MSRQRQGKMAAMCRHLLPIVIALMCATTAQATTCAVTEFTASGTLTAEKLNQRVRQQEACVNGKIGNVNWNSSEPLAVTNLANQNGLYAQSWRIENNASTGAVGQDLVSQATAIQWRVPVTSTIVGMSVHVGSCNSCAVTVTLNKAGSPVKTFSGIATTSTQADFGLSNSTTNAQDLSIDISGTFNGVLWLDIVVYEKAQLQP